MRIIVLCLLMLACAPLTNSPTNAELNKEFFVKLGEVINIKTEDLNVGFDTLLEDSRCPKGARCIHAGNGRIKVKVTRAGKAEQSIELDTAQADKLITYDQYQIKMTQLLPYPDVNKSSNRDEYKVGLIITKK